MSYIGARCPVCEKKFIEGDDIVVCPVCGAPHHRDCYAEEGQCAFEEEHITGKPWKRETPEIKSDPELKSGEPQETGGFCVDPKSGSMWEEQGANAVICSICGAKNPKDNLYCCSCGNRLLPANVQQSEIPPRQVPYGRFITMDPTAAIYGGVLPTEKIEEHTAKEVATFVGRSSSYYVPRFKETADNNGKYQYGFSVSGFFVGFFYFFYRKMYKLGALFLAISLLLSVPTLLIMQESFPELYVQAIGEQELLNQGVDVDAFLDQIDLKKIAKYDQWKQVTDVLSIAFRMFLGFFANHLYFKHVMKGIKKTKEQMAVLYADRPHTLEYEAALTRAGGTSWLGIGISFGVIMVISFVLSYFLIVNGDYLAQQFLNLYIVLRG